MEPCRCCFRTIQKRPRCGKLMFPHKCPHGQWCVTGDRLLGVHQNYPLCRECAKIYDAYWRAKKGKGG